MTMTMVHQVDSIIKNSGLSDSKNKRNVILPNLQRTVGVVPRKNLDLLKAVVLRVTVRDVDFIAYPTDGMETPRKKSLLLIPKNLMKMKKWTG